MKFKVGDKIIINNKRDRYFITKAGSTGIIVAIDQFNGEVIVKFDKVIGHCDLIDKTFGINILDIELLNRKIKSFGIVKFCKENYK